MQLLLHVLVHVHPLVVERAASALADLASVMVVPDAPLVHAERVGVDDAVLDAAVSHAPDVVQPVARVAVPLQLLVSVTRAVLCLGEMLTHPVRGFVHCW